MRRKPISSSCDWIACFYENAQRASSRTLPRASADLPADVRDVVAASLPSWHYQGTSDGSRLRAAAKERADAESDPAFASAVEMFLREEQRHGASLGDWLDRVGIPRRSRDFGDRLIRFFRQMAPGYAMRAFITVMIESMAEIYYAAVRRLVPCPRLRVECGQILRDEVRHIRFQCELLAVSRRAIPRGFNLALGAWAAASYVILCAGVWWRHGRLMRMSGLSAAEFLRAALRKFRVIQRLSDPERYYFPAARGRLMMLPIRVRG